MLRPSVRAVDHHRPTVEVILTVVRSTRRRGREATMTRRRIDGVTGRIVRHRLGAAARPAG